MTCSAFQLAEAPCPALPIVEGSAGLGDGPDEAAGATGVDAAEALSGLFGQPVPLSPWRSSGGVRYIGRWRHGSRRGDLPPLRGHLITATHVGTGLVILTRDGQRTAGQLRRGAVSILPEGRHGHVDFTGERECSQVIVPVALLDRCAAQAGMAAFALAERVTIVDATLFQLVDMLTADSPDAPSDALFREQCATLLCTHLIRRHSRSAQAHSTDAAPGLAGWQLRRIQDYMHEQLHAPLTLQDIAAQVALSRHYVCTAFRHSTGFTPYEYLTTLRIGRAKQLLVATRQSISDIAVAVGYGTASAFTASFRRATGTTPSRFRARS